MVATAATIIFYTKRDVSVAMMEAERTATQNMLNLISLNIQGGYNRLVNEKIEIFSILDKEIQNISSMAVSTINGYSRLSESGIISHEEARTRFLKWLQSVPLNKKELFVFGEDGVVLGHSNPKSVGMSMAKIKDVKRRSLNKTMRYDALEESGDWAVFSEGGAWDLQATRKKGLFVPVPEWKWTLGVAVNFQQIESESKVKMENIIKNLDDTFSNIKIYESGFVCIFNGKKEILIAPKSKSLQGFENIVNAYTGNLLMDDLMTAYHAKKSMRYKNEGDIELSEIEVQIAYFKAFDWYTIVAVPVHEIQEPAKTLIFQQSLIVISIFLFSLVAAFYMVSKISKPLDMLSEYAKELPLLDFTRSEEEDIHPIEDLPAKYNDEVGRLAQSFIFMKEELRKNVQKTIETTSAKERLELERMAAENANKAKSEFLANMSHELRTPLNHIIGFTELVVDKNFGELNEIQEEYLGDVLTSSKHLLSLINDILDLSKVEAGKLELDPSEVDLGMLLENSLVMVKEKAMKHQIKMTTDIENIPEMIIADERKIKQVVYNLLSNAVKFTPDGGEIHVAARKVAENAPDDSVEISVKDTGIGLKTEDQDRIFNHFEQVENSASRNFQGTGLGLSLSRQLIELHGGRIWVESKGENQGSTFFFVIPV